MCDLNMISPVNCNDKQYLLSLWTCQNRLKLLQKYYDIDASVDSINHQTFVMLLKCLLADLFRRAGIQINQRKYTAECKPDEHPCQFYRSTNGHGCSSGLHSTVFHTWEEESLVASSFNKSMSGVPIGLHCCKPHSSSFITLLPNFLDNFDTSLLAFDHDSLQILNMESNVLDTISVIHKMFTHRDTLWRSRFVSWLEHKDGVLLLDGMSSNFPRSCLQTLDYLIYGSSNW